MASAGQTKSAPLGRRRARRQARAGLGALGLLLALGGGCQQPTPLFFGEWIDVYGHDRSADEVCGGTFEYLDSYAGALAVEFGVSEHLGEYHWYSQAQYDEDLPCDDSYACAYDDRTIHSPLLPLEHEMVHLANFAAVDCPSALTEGLAEYYSTLGNDADINVAVLVARLDDPSTQPPHREYGMLGRFVGYLVDHFGLEAVLDVCRITGSYPDGAELTAALESVLGQTREELLADFDLDLDLAYHCNEARVYQSRVYACGAAEAAPYAGLVDEEGLELSFTLDCANERTIGPQGDRIWIVERVDIPSNGGYVLQMQGEDVDISEVTLTLAKCARCTYTESFPGAFAESDLLSAGSYWLEVSAPADFRGTIIVTLEHYA